MPQQAKKQHSKAKRVHAMNMELQRQVQAIMQREAGYERQMTQSSLEVDLQTFEQVEPFPMDENGFIVGGDETETSAMSQKVTAFLQHDEMHGGRAQAVWPSMLDLVFPWMVNWQLHTSLMALLLRCLHHRRCGRAFLDYVEFFCGVGSLSRAAIRAGLRGVSLDKLLRGSHDVMESAGLRLWLLAITATKRKALVHLGVPCSSFVVMCKAQSCRYETNDYLGDENRWFVMEGNILADISALLLLLVFLLECYDSLEQPLNSVLPATPLMRSVLLFIQSHRTVTYHFQFGGPTLKPLQLWSSRAFMSRMERDRPVGLVGADEDEELVQRGPDGAFTGHKARLVASQAYTLAFGRCLIEALMDEWAATP